MHVDRRVLRVSRPVNGWTLTTVAAELLPGFTKSFAQQAMLRRPDGDLCARRVPQLVQTMLDVRLYRALGDHQSLRDLTIAQSVRQQSGHLLLTQAQHRVLLSPSSC